MFGKRKTKIPKIARFERISIQQAMKDCPDDEWARATVEMPQRATKNSAGYDFHCPYDVTLKPGDSVVIPTFMRCWMEPGWVLEMYPRSSLGFKYKVRLDNTVGIIDADYYGSDNEGHIMLAITNCGDKTMTLKENDRMCQGVFLPFGETIDDDASAIRKGGIGSTGR
jgi:dUTP pyrophosphatase